MASPTAPTHELVLALAAKAVCSAVFVSGRSTKEAIERCTGLFFLPAEIRHAMSVSVNHRAQTVDVVLDARSLDTARLPGPASILHERGRIDWYRRVDWCDEGSRAKARGIVRRRARYVDGRGAAILPVADAEMAPRPQGLSVEQRPAASQRDRPAGLGNSLPPSRDIDGRKVEAALDAAFADPEAHTRAFLAIHRGRIIGERYADDCHSGMPLESWSMGKSLVATFVGILAQQGRVGLHDPAPIREWQSPGDSRAQIAIADLLRMSSGLRCSGMEDPIESWDRGVPDHFYIYCEAIDVSAFAVDRPAECAPNTVGRYRNCDTLALGTIVRRVVEAQGEDHPSWPQRMLFDRLGIDRMVLEADLFGNFIISGFNYGTARDWGRLGLLYLRNGVWQGERVLPEGWAEFVGTPAPAWELPEYGGQFWTNGTGEFDLPRDAYSMAGWGAQRVFIVPSLDLVVVRLGDVCGEAAGEVCLNRALSQLSDAIAGTA